MNLQERFQEAERRHQVIESLSNILTALNSEQGLAETLAFITARCHELLRPDTGVHYRRTRRVESIPVAAKCSFIREPALQEGGRRYELVEQAAAGIENDRLAREIHDSVNQTLFSIGLIAEALPRLWQRQPEVGQQGLEDLRRLVRDALAQMVTLTSYIASSPSAVGSSSFPN